MVKMKHKKMVVMLVVLFSVILTACSSNEPKRENPEYTREDITLKFKNESGIKCYIEIKGYSFFSYIGEPRLIPKFSFPSILKIEIPIGGEKSITVKDVVVSGKIHSDTVTYQKMIDIKAFSDDSKYRDGVKSFVTDSKNQYTGGTFHIKLKNNVFDIGFVN